MSKAMDALFAKLDELHASGAITLEQEQQLIDLHYDAAREFSAAVVAILSERGRINDAG